MVVAHNLSAMNAYRQFGINAKSKAKTSEKLSSGYQINRAADDAAGLSISEKMRKQINGLERASMNSQDGISMVQIADGALSEINDMLNRCVELSVQAANGTLSVADRQAIQSEINEIRVEIDGIKEKTKFNEIKVLEPENPGVPVYVEGSGVEYYGDMPQFITSNAITNDNFMSDSYSTTETVTYKDVNGDEQTEDVQIKHAAARLDFSQFNGSVDQLQDMIGKGMYFTCCTCSNHYSIEFVDEAVNSMETSGNHYIFKIGVQGASTPENLIDRILEATKDSEGLGNPMDHYTKLVRDGQSLIVYDDRSQDSLYTSNLPAGAKDISWGDWENVGVADADKNNGYGLAGPGIAKAELEYDHTEYPNYRAQVALQTGADTGNQMIIKLPAISSHVIGIAEVDVLTQDTATQAIDAFKNAGAYVSKEQSRMGAYQNRLEHTIANLDNTIENTTAAESRIRDADMAELMVQFSKENILAQAGQSMLAQANTSTQGVLSLLG